MRRLAVTGVLLALALPGCFAELLTEGPLTTLRFACGVMDRTRDVDVVAHVEEGGEAPVAALRAVAAELDRVARRPAGSVGVRVGAGAERPDGGWDAGALEEWAQDQDTEARAGLRLHVLWASALPEPAATGMNLAPGVVALSLAEVHAAAGRTGRTLEEVAAAVLLHYAGHALGAVNAGIPVQDADLQKREYPPGHDPDLGSVMHATWHQAATLAWDERALRFPDGVVQDLRGAAAPGGVCP